MTMKPTIFLILLVNLLSCKENSNKSDDLQDHTQELKPKPEANYTDISLENDFSSERSVYFSDVDKQDKFTLNVPAGRIYDTYSSLQILSMDGQELFTLKFKTIELINGYEAELIVNKADFQTYFMEKAKDVLHPESFFNFNNLPNESYLKGLTEQDFYDFVTLTEIKAENRFIFVFTKQEEDILYYGYSKKLRKVVEIYGCC
jgi:hypothetical protein